MLTVRLSEEMEKQLNELARKLKLNKSEVVKEAISLYIKQNSQSPYETGKDLFGCDNSEITDGSTKYKDNVRRKIHEKHSH
ncbi:MAG: ribbon-helix-helix domain-containing protein [Bacillota bacterium]|nr:ribbon-helix-helix domain-containing protein [Bacillota bacterium]MDW7682654.1 ribbon-helix-helix domain-containing protein [Bacillota bacterium]